jgi:hypothetical protein
VRVAAFDFPFSIPNALLHDENFAQQMGQAPFGKRGAWAKFVATQLHLTFDDDSLDAELHDLDNFAQWRNKTYWVPRSTDKATNGSPPLKHKFQNVFAMTLAGTALLERLGAHGYTTLLDSATATPPSCVVETYPRAVAQRIGHTGSYKAAPEKCMARAEAFLSERGIRLEFDVAVRRFCETYRTSGSDPDGADAFLCLVAAISCSEGLAEMCGGQATSAVLKEEGAVIVPSLILR